MNKSMYLNLFQMILKSPDGIEIEIEKSQLKRLKAGLAKRKTIFNDEAKLYAFKTNTTPEIIDKHFNYDISESSDTKIKVSISLVSPPVFQFTLVGTPND